MFRTKTQTVKKKRRKTKLSRLKTKVGIIKKKNAVPYLKYSGKRRRLVRRIDDDSEEEFIPTKGKSDADLSDDMMEIEQDHQATKITTAMTPIADRLQVGRK